jgi:hypothetical protein
VMVPAVATGGSTVSIMFALLRFHAVVGVRVAVRSFAPLFCALLAWVMLQMYPAALVTGLARELFGPRPGISILLSIGGLLFLLPAWGGSRIALGTNGWLRHLAPSELYNRRSLELAFMVVQLPAWLAVGMLALVSSLKGVSPWRPVLLQLFSMSCAGALAALPVSRRWLTLPVASAAGATAALLGWRGAAAVLPVLVAAELLSGRLRRSRRRPTGEVRLPFTFAISARAVGLRVLPAYAGAAVPILGAWLFVGNNELRGGLAAGAYRFGFALSLAFLLSAVSETLAVRRPVWPWARSLPWGSRRRVGEDALFLACLALPCLAAGQYLHRAAALSTLLLLPALALRAAGSIRRVRERRFGVGSFAGEACFAAAVIALVPWSQWAAPLLAAPAMWAATRVESRQKVTRWLEAHHASSGDSQSWSDE